MAKTWYLNWQCCFQTRTGKQYAVNIYTETAAQQVRQLVGAETPFVTQEEDEDDVFVSVRSQSGYLRVEDLDGTLLEELMPANNTERFVELVEGTYTGTWPNGTFQRGIGAEYTLWRGFLQAEAFTQSWDGQAKVLEFPVRSLLGTLADTQMDASLAGNDENVAKVLVRAMDALGVEPYQVTVASEFSFTMDMMSAVVQLKAFFTEEEVTNEGDTTMVTVGDSYYSAISSIFALMGLTVREEGPNIVIGKLDGIVGVETFTWAQVVSISQGESVSTGRTTIGDSQLLTVTNFMGADNVAGFVPGAKVAKVELALLSSDTTVLQLPFTTEDSSQTYDIQELAEGVSVIQPHEQRQDSNEYYTMGACVIKLWNGPDPAAEWRFTTSQAQITMQTFLSTSIMQEPLLYPRVENRNNILYVGAIPCRFYASLSEERAPSLANGMFFQLSGYTANGSWDYPASGLDKLVSEIAVYRINTGSKNWNIKSGWLLIDADIVSYVADFTTYGDYKVYIGRVPQRGVEDPLRYSLHVQLSVGPLFWNGESWVQDQSASFTIDYENGQMVGNKTSDMGVEGEGLFIPVNRILYGVVNFTVLSAVGFNQSYRERDCHTFVAKSLSLTHVTTRPLTASDRTSNMYRQTILQSGFSGEQQIDLTVGTMNNNVDSASFIKSPGVNGGYIQKMKYILQGDIRPEVRLLQRMAAQYGQVRRTFQAVIQQGLNLTTSRYTYLQRKFFGVHSETDWKEEKERVKFIEINN